MENIYHTIRGRTKSPRTLESISKDPLSAAKPYNICGAQTRHDNVLREINLCRIQTWAVMWLTPKPLWQWWTVRAWNVPEMCHESLSDHNWHRLIILITSRWLQVLIMFNHNLNPKIHPDISKNHPSKTIKNPPKSSNLIIRHHQKILQIHPHSCTGYQLIYERDIASNQTWQSSKIIQTSCIFP